ncbi:MAG: ribosome-associated translation inhibitor RaiA [Leptospira sp.]|nr:ribosome-associated translation inhibitor RaiA [Leptospira sp.]
MKINYTWKHVDHSKAGEEYANEKMGKISKFVHNVVSCDMSFELIHGEIHANIKLHADGTDFNAQNTDKDIYTCIDGLESKLQKQLQKFHDKRAAH